MIRPATVEDAAQVMPLLHNAIGTIANTLAGTPDDAEAMRILAEFYKQPGNRISYENVIVEEREGKVAGILVAYDGTRADELDKPLIDRIVRESGRAGYTITKEAQPNEYYLDSLSVDESFQGMGIGKSLIRAFEQKAAEDGYPRVSLIVEQDNERAYALYQKIGYADDGTLQVSGKPFIRMVKPL